MAISLKEFDKKYTCGRRELFYRRCWNAVRGNVLVLGIVSFFTDVSSEMIYPLLPVFFTGPVPAATAAVYIGLMDGIAESISSLLKVFAGRVSDALGKHKSIAVCGYGISTLCRPLMALAASAWQVIGLRFGDRLGKGIRTPARDALLRDSTDPDMRGLAFSFHRAMDHAGAVILRTIRYESWNSHDHSTI